MPKNAHAVALGRRGGKVRSPAKTAAVRRNGLLGGRPATYRLASDGSLERLIRDRWVTLDPPLDAAAQAFLRRAR